MRSRQLGGVWSLACAAGLLLTSADAGAGPNEGETRQITRDADRPYTVVAGEADGASTVTNPANLGYLNAVNAVLDLGWTTSGARRRGSGVGAFVGIPLPSGRRGRRFGLREPLMSLGLGYQYLYPIQPDLQVSEEDSPSQADNPYSKLTVAAAIPLMRWAPGLSVGFGYSRLVSINNFYANANVFDVALGYHPSRYVALGLVAHAVNVPRTGPENSIDVEVRPEDEDDAARPDQFTITATGNRYTQPFVLEPEIALRPTGTDVAEIAAGVRWVPTLPNDGPARFSTAIAEPRVRAFVKLGPARVFAQAEVMRYLPSAGEVGGDLEERSAARLTAGVEFVDANLGVAAGLTASAGGRRGFSADGGVARIRLSAERYEGIDVAPRRVTRLQLSRFKSERGLWQLIEAIDAIGGQGGAAILETRGLGYGWAQLEEVREAIRRARLGGARIISYVEGGGLRSYFVASATEHIIAHPTTSLSIVGMRIETFFFADLLAKLGAKAEFVRIAEYKSVPESYERMAPSRPSDTQRRLLHTDVWNHVLRMISRDRGQDPRAISRWIDTAPLEPRRAVREGVVDSLAYPDQLDAKLEGLLGRRVRIELPPAEDKHAHDYGARPQIAVLVIEGDLSDSTSFEIPILGRKVAGGVTLTKEIERLRKDKNVRAVVVRCNTPGGSVKASDDIARELDLTNAVKPVIISMSNACASGGYYVATGGRFVFADATTVSGSIGIFYPKVDVSGTLDKLGIEVDRVTYGRHAAMRSWLKPYSDEERAAAQQAIQDSYAVFTDRVAASRRMTLARVDTVARGRVWSGVRAREVGLVDRYGGLYDAVERAAAIVEDDRASLDVVLVPQVPSVTQNLRRVFSFDLPLGTAAGSGGVLASAAESGGLGLAGTLLSVLGRLPVGLWLGSGPMPLALAEEAVVISD